ncbi:MAG TPA: ferredoxin family protein [Treponema sp.]|nr:ferredoxin family protein [Treponema sp.]
MRKGSVIIDREMCKGCLLCIRACPFGVLTEDTEMNTAGVYPAFVKNPDACTACSSCYRVCPDCAITVYLDEGDA